MSHAQNRYLSSRPISAALALIAIFSVAQAAGTPRVVAIDFKDRSDRSELIIKTSGGVMPVKSDGENNQVVLEFPGAQLKKGIDRKLDTSSFKGNVSLVSPYQLTDPSNAVRIVVQMRQPGSAEMTTEGNVTKLVIAKSGQEAASAATAELGKGSAALDPPPGATPAAQPTTAASDPAAPADSASATPETPANPRLDEFVTSQSQKKFSGRPITLQVRDADLVDVFRLIADASGFNILVGEDVKGRITLSLQEVPWDQALDVILNTQRLGAERSNNLLRITTLTNLTQEKQAQLDAKLMSEANVPRVTRVFQISYANLGELTTILTKFTAASGPTSPAGGGSLVQSDARTNQIVVRDTADNIEKMKKLIEILDTQTPQVMIEAKVIEATETFTKALGGSLGFSKSGGDAPYFASFAGSDATGSLVGSIAGGGGKASSDGGLLGGAFGITPTLSFLPGIQRLNAFLSMAEAEGSVKVVAAPKTVVLNKESSTIVQSTPVLVPTTNTVAGVGSAQGVTIQSANLSLSVTPTVTNEGSVQMQLAVSRDVPVPLGGNQGVANRNLSTKVLVDSGSTLVIGGIYTMTSSKTSTGFPVLRKIPIIGALFGSEKESSDRSELFIFITPRVLNVKEAGLSS